MELTTRLALRRRGDVAATSLCTSQRRLRYVSNETPNDVLMERRQDVSVVRVSTTSYWYVITTSQKVVTTTPHHYVSTTSQASLKWNTQPRLSHDVPLAHLYNVSCKSQIKQSKNVVVVCLHHVSSYLFATSC